MATVSRLDVYPSYTRGFLFRWDVAPDFTGQAPWVFTVQRSDTQDGEWHDVSPELTQQYSWLSDPLLTPKDPTVYFRVKLTSGANTYYSAARGTYGDLSRHDFLQAREIMRNEVVQARNKAGIHGQVWMKAVHGPKCTACTDPITGAVTDPDCKVCHGTGIVTGYYGPVDVWMTFTARQRNKGMKQDNLGVHEDYVFSVRMIGCPVVKKDDVLVDVNSDRRYYVNAVNNVMELRRIPLVQQIEAREVPTSEQIYDL